MSLPAMNLNQSPTLDILLEGFAKAPAIGVTDITSDSRRVSRGAVFFALGGATQHGLEFAATAVAAGAAAIVYDATTATSMPANVGIPAIGVDHLASRMGEIANRYFGRPSADLDVVGITGTNGKSTVAWMLASALTSLGERCAYSGTLGYGVDAIAVDDTMTSPDVVELNRRLAAFRDAGAKAAAIEVSSHALDQGRVDATRFDSVLFTNLSRDHLDYHGDMQSYGAAKAKLFTDFSAGQRIVSIDSGFGADLAARLPGDTIAVTATLEPAKAAGADVAIGPIRQDRQGSRVALRSIYGEAEFDLPLPGRFNVANAGLVFAYLCARGVSLDDAVGALASISAPPGRMQRASAPANRPGVYVDYAHTPDALEAALDALREHSEGRLWCVFGCGGDRDAGKRPLMGAVAERLADRVVVTNDNPRREPPSAIVADILSGFQAPAHAVAIEDRGTAIAWSIANAAADDLILIAGKGHEPYQLIGDRRVAFSDLALAEACLARHPRPEST